MSIGFLTDEQTPMIWRGPMVTSAIKTFTQKVNWKDLDFIIVDMPPGTGDTQLTFSQESENNDEDEEEDEDDDEYEDVNDDHEENLC